MEKAKVLEIIQSAGDNPVAIFCDNAKILYVNIDDWYLFDDDGEGFISVHKNLMAGQDIFSQENSPWVLVYTNADHIQQINVYPKKKDMKDAISGLTKAYGFNTDINKIKESILSSSIMKATMPRSFRNDDKAPDNESYGGDLGSAVYMEKDIPAFEKRMISEPSKD